MNALSPLTERAAALAADPAMIWILATLVTVAVAAVSGLALRAVSWLTLGAWRARAIARSARRLPGWLRAALPLANPLADACGPRLPLWVRNRAHEALRRAELEEELSAQLWLALCALWATVAFVLAVVLPGPLVFRLALAGALIALPWVWLFDCRRRRDWEILRDLPAYVDMLTLALEAGSALSTALRATTAKAPDGVLQRAFLRLQGDLRAGRSRVEALRALGERMDSPAVAPMSQR